MRGKHMGTLRVDENEINYGFVNNMDGAKSNIEYANTKINWLFDNYCSSFNFKIKLTWCTPS